MAQRLDAARPGFDKAFEALLGAKRETAEDVDRIVASIIADVVARGDEALVEFTRRFDRHEVAVNSLRITESEIDAALEAADPQAVEALRLALPDFRKLSVEDFIDKYSSASAGQQRLG